jgi:SET and MYND domain-containing protein
LATRRIRGYACYPSLAFANHSCLPSIARFDSLDLPFLEPPPPLACVGALAAAAAAAAAGAAGALPAPHSIATRYVAMHELPAGAELTISYMPLGDPPDLRRQRLRAEYNFSCDCARCQVEAASEAATVAAEAAEVAKAMAAAGGAADAMAMEQGDEERPPFAVGDVDETYVALYVLKHVCDQCLGTMAPLITAPSSCLCNRCGTTRTEAEFLARAEAHFAGDEHEHEDDEEMM